MWPRIGVCWQAMGLTANDWTAIGTVVIAGATLAAAVFAARAARATRKAAQGQLLVTMLTEWGSDDMRKAIADLTASLGGGDRLLLPSRQTLALYFQKVHELHRIGAIDDGVVEAVASRGQAELYLSIEPLERKNNPQYSTASFEFFSRKYGLQRRLEGWQP